MRTRRSSQHSKSSEKYYETLSLDRLRLHIYVTVPLYVGYNSGKASR